MPTDIYRLTDIEVQEVSVVDRAANKRKFLVVKSEENSAMPKSIEVKPDGKGNLEIAKDDPATPPAPGAPPSTDAPAAPPPAEVVIRMSPGAQAEMVKRCDGAIEKLNALKALVSKAQTEDGITEIPQEVVDAVGGIVHLLSEGEDDAAAPAPEAPPAPPADDSLAKSVAKSFSIEITKGRKQISMVREAKLRAAAGALSDILAELAPPADVTVEPSNVDAMVEVTEKTITKSMLSYETKLAKSMDGLLKVVKNQNEAIAKQAARIEQISSVDRGRTTANGATAEEVTKAATPTPTPWSLDMSEPNFGKGLDATESTRR